MFTFCSSGLFSKDSRCTPSVVILCLISTLISKYKDKEVKFDTNKLPCYTFDNIVSCIINLSNRATFDTELVTKDLFLSI